MLASDRARYVNQAEATPSTGRSERHYVRVFDVDPAELVLDLGSGASDFPNYPNTIQLDQAYSYTGSNTIPTEGLTVAGIYEELPFRSNVFGRATIRFGTQYLSLDAAQITVLESLRVLEDGGTLQVFPIHSGKRLRKTVERLNDYGYEVSYGVPQIMKHRALGFAALAGTVIGLGVGMAYAGSESVGTVIGFFGGISGGMFANFHARSGVLGITKQSNMGYRGRQVVAEQLSPFIISPQNVRI